MSKHSIRAEIEVSFHLSGAPDDEREVAYPKVDIEFSFTSGCPATGPSYASGGDPASPAEVEMISATLADGDGLAPTQDQVDDWAKDWLSDAGYHAALDVAADAGPDPDAAYEAARDDRELERHLDDL